MKKILQIFAGILGLAGLACLGLYFFKGGANGKLTWEDPNVRKSLMTFAYKIYGDPAVENGRFFLSKIVFHNEGAGPVHDLSVSYQIPDYVSWTTPATQSELPAGQTLVTLYYPQLPSKVTQLTSQTNAVLETKIHWANNKGEAKEEILRSTVILHGVNEVEYTDLPESELEGFYDYHALSEVEVAMVTPNDPVVKEFVAEVTKRTGGTLAGIQSSDPSEQLKEALQFMKAAYDYMCETGMRYTSNEGVPSKTGDISTLIQTVRMPRDVIITNQGLCVELAILWASILQQVGLDPSLVFIPGHCYTAVSVAGKTLGIECTAITPKAIKSFLKPLGLSEDVAVVPFDKAIALGNHELSELDQMPHQMINVRTYQQAGIRAPELPSVETDKIKNILAQRSEHTAAAYAQNVGADARVGAQNNKNNKNNKNNDDNSQVRQGYYRWVGANSSASVDIPATWTRTENGSVPGMVFTAQDARTSVGLSIFHYPNLSSAVDAMQTARRGIAQAVGGNVRVANEQRKGNMMIYTGTTSFRGGAGTEWAGFFAPIQNGVVGLFIGTAKGSWQKCQPLIQDVMSSIRINGGAENGSDGGNQDQ